PRSASPSTQGCASSLASWLLCVAIVLSMRSRVWKEDRGEVDALLTVLPFRQVRGQQLGEACLNRGEILPAHVQGRSGESDQLAGFGRIRAEEAVEVTRDVSQESQEGSAQLGAAHRRKLSVVNGRHPVAQRQGSLD